MANANLFNTKKTAPQADTTNKAGGRAYSMSAKHALTQYATTGMFGGTYYTQASVQLEEVLKLAEQVESEFIAKLAVYSRQRGFMKDMPALLLAVLTARKETELLKKVFYQVVDNGKMLRNYVQIVRSGVTGRKSLGTAPKKLIVSWLNQRSDAQIFRDSVGNNPSLADVIKMVHPKAETEARNNLYSYLIGKSYDADKPYPGIVQAYEAFKAGTSGAREVPNVPFQMLDSLNLSDEEWKTVARNAKWHMTRMNLNTFTRHGVLSDKAMVDLIAARLASAEDIRQAKVFPYQIFTAYKNATELPQKLRNALHDAVEVAIENIPSLSGKICVGVDMSGSMSASVSVNGRRASATSCADVAGLVASSILRKNPDTDVYTFNTTCTKVDLDARDTVLTNTKKLSRAGGGTDMSSVLRHLNAQRVKADLVVLVSDNESWSTNYYQHTYRGTGVSDEWLKFKARNKNAKLVCIDIVANTTTQAKSSVDTLNVGGFSDQVFTVMSAFLESGGNPEYWVSQVEKSVEL